jgi:hypothetical protein
VNDIWIFVFLRMNKESIFKQSAKDNFELAKVVLVGGE